MAIKKSFVDKEAPHLQKRVRNSIRLTSAPNGVKPILGEKRPERYE